jgi:iron(III) transport system substrate-binding protein
MLTATDEATRKVAEQVQVIWPDQGENGLGTHINVSGAALVAGAKNKSNAEKLLAYMLTEQAQQWYAQVNHEYPVIDGVAWSPELVSFGQFTAENVPLGVVGADNAKGLMLMDKAGWK